MNLIFLLLTHLQPVPIYARFLFLFLPVLFSLKEKHLSHYLNLLFTNVTDFTFFKNVISAVMNMLFSLIQFLNLLTFFGVTMYSFHAYKLMADLLAVYAIDMPINP